jgi:hypothetical protein
MKSSVAKRAIMIGLLLGCTARSFAQQSIFPTQPSAPRQESMTPAQPSAPPAQPTVPPTSDVTAQQQRPQLPQGLTYEQMRPGNAKLVYTHYVGAFVLDTTALFTTTHAIFRSRPHPNGPLAAYDHRITYIGSWNFPHTGEYGHFCYVTWPTHPQQDRMPAFLFFSDGDHCGQYNVYSWRWIPGYWRHIGCFVRAPLGTP